MAYDPLTGRFTTKAEDLLARLNKRAASPELARLEKLAETVANPIKPSRVKEREATAEARGLVTQANRDLQRDNLALAQSRASTTSANADNAAEALKKQQEAAAAAEEKRRQGQSAYDLLFSEFSQYGMGALIEPLKGFIQEGLSPSEFTLRLRGTDAYKKRFAANASRIAKGLGALSEAEYIGLEDQYQNIMRNYGLPPSYYTRGEMGRQEGFEKFLAG
jgi:hypothetical protein